MAKKLLSFLKCPTQNISIQVTDPDKICGCIKQLHQNNELLRDIYDAYFGMVKVGDVKLRETDDTLTKMGVVLTNFDSSLKRWGGHLQTGAERLQEKEQRLERLKREVEFDKKWLLEKREEVPMKWQDDEYQKAMRVQKIRDCRAEQDLLEMKMKMADEQIEKVLENIEESEGKYDSIQKLRANHNRAHKADLQNMIVDWDESREKREILQSLDIDPKTLVSSLAYKEDWRAKDRELSDLRNEHDMLRENLHDQQDRKDVLRLRNEELRKRILHNESVLQSLRDEAREEQWNKESPFHKHEDRHDSSQRHGKGGTSHRHHDKDSSSHRHSHRHHDHGTSHHRHHSHAKSHRDHDTSTSHKYSSRSGSPPRHGGRDGSPPRHHGHRDRDGGTSHNPRHGVRDGSPPRHHGHRDHEGSTSHKYSSRSGSPPRHGGRDGSPPRHHGHRDHEGSTSHNPKHGVRDGSPPRPPQKDGATLRQDYLSSHKTKGRDISPPGHTGRDVSPPKHDKMDGSPPNRHHGQDHGNRDLSHGNKEGYHGIKDWTHGSRNGPHVHREGSPPRHQDHYGTSTPDHKPVPTKNRDGSPPRHVHRDTSPPRHEDRGISHGNRSPPRSDKGSHISRQEQFKEVHAQRRGSRATSLRHGTSNTAIETEGIGGTETKDGSDLREQMSTSQFGSQTAVEHQSSNEEFTQL